jgi:hypothetical protein
MKQNETIFSQIDDYLKGNLSEDEKLVFEAEYTQNTELQQQVEATRLANLALMRHKLWEVKSLSETIDKEEKQKGRTKRIVTLATGLSILVVGITYLMVSQNKEVTKAETTIKPQVTRVETKHSTETPTTIGTKAQTKSIPTNSKKMAVCQPTVATNNIPLATTTRNEEVPVLPQTQSVIATQAVESTKQAETKKPEDPCANTNIEAYVSTEKACLGDQNGSIQVSGFKGGQQPYQFKVLDESNQAVAATRLGVGIYTVLVTDSRHCTRVMEGVMVKEADCRKDFELNLGNGEVLELDVVSKSATFVVYDKGGNKYFYKEFGKGEKILWNGASSHGEMQGGYFQFQINYQDGETRTGSVTVVK